MTVFLAIKNIKGSSLVFSDLLHHQNEYKINILYQRTEYILSMLQHAELAWMIHSSSKHCVLRNLWPAKANDTWQDTCTHQVYNIALWCSLVGKYHYCYDGQWQKHGHL